MKEGFLAKFWSDCYFVEKMMIGRSWKLIFIAIISIFTPQNHCYQYCDENCLESGTFCIEDDPTAFSVCRGYIRLGTWHCSSGFIFDPSEHACRWPMLVESKCQCSSSTSSSSSSLPHSSSLAQSFSPPSSTVLPPKADNKDNDGTLIVSLDGASQQPFVSNAYDRSEDVSDILYQSDDVDDDDNYYYQSSFAPVQQYDGVDTTEKWISPSILTYGNDQRDLYYTSNPSELWNGKEGSTEESVWIDPSDGPSASAASGSSPPKNSSSPTTLKCSSCFQLVLIQFGISVLSLLRLLNV